MSGSLTSTCTILSGADWLQQEKSKPLSTPRPIALPVEGCIVLGTTGEAGHKYNTRYRIDHHLQHKDMTSDIVIETCVPCCLDDNKQNFCRFVWSIISSEAFLLLLHLLALGLGVSKEALRIRDEDEELDLIQSITETAATCLQMSIRTVNACLQYKSIKSHITRIEEIESYTSVRGASLRCYVISFCVFGIVMVAGAIVSMVAFKNLAHLGWTILSNNFVLVVGTVCARIVTDRLDKVISVIREDQQKAVLYEATLLLKEARQAFSSQLTGQYFNIVNKFIKSLHETDLFNQPDHIKQMDGHYHNIRMFHGFSMQSQV